MASIRHCDILCESLEHLGNLGSTGGGGSNPHRHGEVTVDKAVFLAAQIPTVKGEGALGRLGHWEEAKTAF